MRYSRFDHFKSELDTTNYKNKIQMYTLFIKINSSFRRIFHPSNNFFQYRYLINKIAELLNIDTQFPYFKSKLKLEYYDNRWKKICDDNGFPFIKSKYKNIYNTRSRI